MDQDDAPPARPAAGVSPRRFRPAMVVAGMVAAAVVAVALDRAVMVRPGATQRIVVSRLGEVTGVYGPGQSGMLNPWSQGRTVYDTAMLTSDRSAGNRGMAALSAEGHAVTVFGTAFWHEGDEADTRWRFAHLRDRPDAMPVLMGAAVQTVVGRRTMDGLIRDGAAVQAALTAELRERARELLRVEVAGFVLTGLDPGESFRQVVAEREMGKARAGSIAASPALAAQTPYALELERIRRWDGRGVMPGLSGRGE